MAKNDLDLTVAIITLNEESNMDRCLRSLPKSAEVVVLDSGSSDQTCQIAERYGARVETRPFTNYADQKNAAIGLASRQWILSLDADEELSPQLRQSLESFVATSQSGVMKVRRRLVFMGRPMSYGRTVDYPLRLFRKGQGQFEAAIHEKFVTKASTTPDILAGDLLHYSYHNIEDYFSTFNRYTTLIASNHQRQGRHNPTILAHLLRPWFEFLNRYFLKLGFLDGYPGYTYALFSSLYTYVKYAKLRELKAQKD